MTDAPAPATWPLSPAQEGVVALLASYVRRGGAARLTRAPIAAADERAFPDAWEATPESVHRLLYRLAWHAHLDVAIALRDARQARRDAEPMLTRTELELLEASPGELTFELAAIGNDNIAGRLAHAIGDGYALLAPVDPFRGTRPEVTEAEASVAAVYLGLGVLVANSSMYRRYASRVAGRSVQSEERIERTGGLSISDATLLLAIQDLVRDAHEPALESLLPPQQEWLQAWCAVLDPVESEVRELLGLADAPAGELPTRPAAPRSLPAVTPLVRSSVGALVRLRINEDKPTFRVPYRSHGRAFLGIVTAGGAALAVPGVGLLAAPFAALAGGIAGYALAWRGFRCSDAACQRIMRDELATCPGCGGTILETIAHADDRLDRLEALEAGDEAAAAPRVRT